MEIAKILFAQNGFDATSVRDIAHQASINVAMINYYFTSKENLLDAIISHGVESYKLQEERYVQEEDPIVRLEKLVDHYLESKFSDLLLYQILINEVQSRKRLAYQDVFKDLRKHNTQKIQEVVDYGVAKGAFRPYDAMLLHSTMIGTFLHMKMNQQVLEETISLASGVTFDSYLKDTLTSHLKYILRAILVSEIDPDTPPK